MKLFSSKSIKNNIAVAFLSTALSLSLVACGGGGGGGGGAGDGSDNGGSGGGTSGTSDSLKNTTWLFLRADSENTVCSGPHGTGKPEESDPLNPGAACTDTPTLVVTVEKNQQESIDENVSGYYLHVDSSGVAFFGKVEYHQSGTMYFDRETKSSKYVCSKHIPEHEGPTGAGSIVTKKPTKYDTSKTNLRFSPLAKGRTIARNSKLEFEFPYGLGSVAAEKFFAYGLTSSEKTSVEGCKLLKLDGSSYQNVAKVSSSGLTINYDSGTSSCQQYQNSTDDTKCNKTITTTYFTKWEKFDFDEAMKGPKHDPDSVLSTLKANKLYYSTSDTPVFNTEYPYIEFTDNCTYNSYEAKTTYKGLGYFNMDSIGSASQKNWSHLKTEEGVDKIIFTEDSGNLTYTVYTLESNGSLKLTGNTAYRALGKTYRGKVSAASLNENQFKHKKSYARKDYTIAWYSQNAEWTNDDGKYLKYSNPSKYVSNISGSEITFNEFGQIDDSTYLLIDTVNGKTYLLADKGETVKIYDDSGVVAVLAYSKRVGYVDSDYVEVTFKCNRTENFTSIKNKYLNYEYTDENNEFKVVIPKATTIGSLKSGGSPVVGSVPKAYTLKIKDGSENGAEISDSATVDSNRNIFVDASPDAAAFKVTFKLGTKLAASYRFGEVSGYENSVNSGATECTVLVLPTFKIQDTVNAYKRDPSANNIDYKYMNGQTEISSNGTFQAASITGECTINIVPTVDIVDYTLTFVGADGLTFQGTKTSVTVTKTSVDTIGGNNTGESLFYICQGQDYYWVYNNKVIYCSKTDLWDSGVTGTTKLGDLGFVEGNNSITVKPIQPGKALPAEFTKDRITVSITGLLTSGNLDVAATKSTTVDMFYSLLNGSLSDSMASQGDYMAMFAVMQKLNSAYSLKNGETVVISYTPPADPQNPTPDNRKLSAVGINGDVTLTFVQ